MRSKFGGKGDEEEDEDEIEKKELEDNERRAKHSIEGILGDRCEWTLPAVIVFVLAKENKWNDLSFFISVSLIRNIRAQQNPVWSDTSQFAAVISRWEVAYQCSESGNTRLYSVLL